MSEVFLSRGDEEEFEEELDEELEELEKEIKKSTTTQKPIIQVPSAKERVSDNKELEELLKKKREQKISPGMPLAMVEEEHETKLEDLTTLSPEKGVPNEIHIAGRDFTPTVWEARYEFKDDLKQIFKNEITATDGNQIIVYVGKAWGLYFYSSTSIFGNVSLTKYIKKNYQKNKLQVEKVFPPKLYFRKVPAVKYSKVWHVSGFGYSNAFFVNNGYIVKFSSGYKHDLQTSALEKEIKLTDDFLEAVFAPIDKKLLEIYNHRHGKE